MSSTRPGPRRGGWQGRVVPAAPPRVAWYSRGMYFGRPRLGVNWREWQDRYYAHRIHHDGSAFEYFLRRFHGLLVGERRGYFSLDGAWDWQDWQQVSWMGLWEALLVFDRRHPRSVTWWVRIILRHRLADVLKYQNRMMRRGGLPPLSLDAPWGYADDSLLSEMIPDTRVTWDTGERAEAWAELLDRVQIVLSDMEWQVFCEYLRKHSLKHAATRLGLHPKQVDNAWARIQRKLSLLPRESQRANAWQQILDAFVKSC